MNTHNEHAMEGVYALLAGAIGLSPAAGLTLALVRRVRGLLIASAGVLLCGRSSVTAEQDRDRYALTACAFSHP